MKTLKGVCIGTGYFSQFHLDAWQRIPEVDIVAICDANPDKALTAARSFGIKRTYSDYLQMFEREKPDFVDVITPPASHLEICRTAADMDIYIICQKPLAPTYPESQAIVQIAQKAGVRLMVHENFRFQPWHREIKKLLNEQVTGDKLHTLYFRTRMGDGWGEDAYLNRQPYFRTMPRLLVHETGVHYIDTFRFLAGEISRVYAVLKKLNPVIAGEDFAHIQFDFTHDALGVWDANRYNESHAPDPRYTFGEFLVESNGGTIRLYPDGRITIQPLGKPETPHPYVHEKRGFAGDCCYFTQRHFIDCLVQGRPFETDGADYLKNLQIQEAIYQSAAERMPVSTING